MVADRLGKETRIQSTIKTVVNFPFFFPLWNLLTWTQRQFKGQNCTTRKADRTAKEIICLGHKEQDRGLLRVKRVREIPSFVCCYHLLHSHPNTRQTWGSSGNDGSNSWVDPKFPTRGTEVQRPWEEVPLHFFSLLILSLLDLGNGPNIMEKSWETCSSVGKRKPWALGSQKTWKRLWSRGNTRKWSDKIVYKLLGSPPSYVSMYLTLNSTPKCETWATR